ncbi:MAG TPA: sigma-E factor negative regulatory protein, partial [Burkholderiaceae bacterium]|nr:sigma-E factor negative regulatory protein [Burkholderiaceae bacterium]
SSLIDGELDAREAAAVIDALCRDAELQHRWSDLQLVGDALRSTEVAACHVDGFCARVRKALAHEPVVFAPSRARPGWRRYAVPGFAVAASVAALAFVAVPLLRAPSPDVMAQKPGPAAAVVAANTEPVPAEAATKAAAAIATARALDPYFAAHRELTAGTPLPRATAYLRTSAGER